MGQYDNWSSGPTQTESIMPGKFRALPAIEGLGWRR